MAYRGKPAHGIFDRLVKGLLTRCNRYPIATAPEGQIQDSIAKLTLTEPKATAGPEHAEGPPDNYDQKEGKPPAREPIWGLKKNWEAMRNSACAALKAVDNMGGVEKEEEEEEYTPSGRPPLAAFSNVRASTPGVHGTPFVSRRGGRNER